MTSRGLRRASTRRLEHATGGGVITRTVLPGGLRIVTEAMPGVRSASVGVWVPVGSRDESPALAGTSHFLEHLLFKGTSRRSALDIASAMDAVGGEFNAFTEKEHTCFYATVLDRDLTLAVDIVADVVLDATVTGEDVDIERGVVLEEIAMRDDDPADLVHDEFAAALFGDVPLGRPILGTAGSIHALSRRQVHGYYRRRYTADGMVVAVAGNVDHGEVVRMVRRAFEASLDASRGTRAARAAANGAPPLPNRGAAVRVDDTEQANLVLGCHGLSRHDPRRFAVGVLSAALGGGMSSRLFQRVREERGLAYSVYSFSSGYTDAGMFGVYAGCQPGKADEVLALVLAELDGAARGELTDAEIERGKGQMRGATVLGLEDGCSRMTRIGKSEIIYGEVLGVDELLARIDAITPSDVAELAGDLLRRPRSLAVVGPFGEHDFDGAV
ncbi:MAG TPA: pitrilysin family protein [Jatrophihabitans sp.]|jgi:predicted Zn-dependent peptidase|nr:pitrilysin family protein [Jatrophihabitans sp.]